MSLHFPELSPETLNGLPRVADASVLHTIARIPRRKVVAGAAGAAAKPADGKGPITSPVTYQVKIGEVSHKDAKRAELEQGGWPRRQAMQRKDGKQTACERIDALVDADSFEESGLFAQHRQTLFGMADKEVPADGVVTGAASIDGRLFHLASQDFTVLGGSAGELHSNKVADVMELALHTGSPFIFINDSGGARVQEGIDSLSGYGRIFFTNVELSGAVPRSP